jgi:hypothetical protein
MEASPYEIKRWDPIMLGNNISQCPAIYIIPNTDFLLFARNNNFRAFCKINNSNTIYDGHLIRCTINKSSVVPNCRPNFFAESGLYIITLDTFWYGGYPSPNNLGSVHFYGFAAPITPVPPSESNPDLFPLVEKQCTEPTVVNSLNNLASILST